MLVSHVGRKREGMSPARLTDRTASGSTVSDVTAGDSNLRGESQGMREHDQTKRRMPAAAANEVALRVHLALDALLRGKGSQESAHLLMQSVVLCRFLCDEGCGRQDEDIFDTAEAAIVAVTLEGRSTGNWSVGERAAGPLAAVVCLYDYQLQTATLSVLSDVETRYMQFVRDGLGQRRLHPRAATHKSGSLR